jgi:hypothetical protein
MTRHMISCICAASFFTLFSCSPGDTMDAGDGGEDGQPETDQTGDNQTDPRPDGDVIADPQPDGDIVADPQPDGDVITDPQPDGDVITDGTEGVIKVADPQGSPGTAGNGFLALDDTHVYFGYKGTTVGGVAMVGKDGTGATCIACDQGEPRWLAADGVSVYWADIGLDELRSAPLGGGTVTTLWSGTMGTPVAVDASHVFWFDSGANRVMQADLDGGNPATVEAGQTNVNSLAADGGFLFWTTQTDIMAEDLSAGGPATPLSQGRTDPGHVAADATHVYWAEGPWGGTRTVQRILRTGGTEEQVAPKGAFAIALDATHVYGTDNSGGLNGEIWRVPKGGGTIEVLAGGQAWPFDIADDDAWVYWASETTAEVFKVAK